jgi:hypothetical protein
MSVPSSLRLPAPLRLLSFWLGLPTFLFLFWIWRDSMLHAAALHREHGNTFVMRWPPVEAKVDLPAALEDSVAGSASSLQLPSLEVPSLD